jgi:DnaJ-domain-containing protein 1
VERSAAINLAYKTLSEPIKRAAYLLAREAGVSDLEALRAPADILVEVLETRERIAELKFDERPEAQEALRQEKRKAEEEKLRLDALLETLFARVDAGDRSAVPEVERALVLHRYNSGVLRELASVAS